MHLNKVILSYKNKCILFKKLVCLFTNNPNLVRKVHSWLDNETATDLKRRLSQTTDERLRNDANDAWPVDIKGSLLGINNLVANKTLLHKRCSTIFFKGESNVGDEDISK